MSTQEYCLDHAVTVVPKIRSTSREQQNLLADILKSRAQAFARGNRNEESTLRQLLLDASSTYL